MKRYLLHTPFSIYHFEAEKWIHPVHKHTYFEIIFILKGEGIHNINSNSFRYSDGDVFFLGPEDYHDFEIENLTEFCFVRFNDSIHKKLIEEKDVLGQQLMNVLLQSSSQSRGTIVEDKKEREKLFGLLSVLEAENDNNQSKYFDDIRSSLMRSMLLILARNLFGQSPSPMMKDSVEAILVYIKQHIFQPEKHNIEHLADIFNYSTDYISIFFKKHTGESLKQFITKYKMNLIEIRLLYSQLTISEIAEEFGYNDESHFCKQFKKFTGYTPTTFRKRSLNSK